MGKEIKPGAREVSWVPVARLGLTLPSPARHGGCKKRPQPPRRLPSPWTEAVDFLDLGARASKKLEHWRARLLRKTEKIDSLWTGRGTRKGGIRKGERGKGTLSRF